jgi:hypothetical protein
MSRLRRRPAEPGVCARRRRDHHGREQPRVADRRRRRHARPGRGRGHLSDQHGRAGPIHRGSLRGQGLGRRGRRALAQDAVGARRAAPTDAGGARARRRGARERSPGGVFRRLPGRRGSPPGAGGHSPRRDPGRGPGDAHLHQRHHGPAQGRDAEPSQPGLHGGPRAADHRAGHTRGLRGLLPAAVAHRRTDVLHPRLHRRGLPHLGRRRAGPAEGHAGGRAAHRVHGRAAGLGEVPGRARGPSARDEGPQGRHRGLGPRRGPAADAADRRVRAARRPGRPEVRPCAQAFLRQTRRSARARPPARGRQRRRAHRPQHARVLRQRGHHHPRGLRPVRGLGAHDLQPAVPRAAAHRHRGPALPGVQVRSRRTARSWCAATMCSWGTTSSPRPPPRR